MTFTPRKFAPLTADHPSVGQECPVCGARFVPGDELSLVPIRSVEPHLAEAAAIHWRCLPEDLRSEAEG